MAAPKIITMLREIGVEVDDVTLKILNMLERKENISENIVAQKLKLKINGARKLLYKLSSLGLVTYTKQKDPDKKWWYLYYWSLDKDKLKDIYLQYKKAQLVKKEQLLQEERKYTFECEHCGKKYVYEDALENDFSCPDCGNILVEVKPTETILRLESEINNLKEEIGRREKVEHRLKTIKDNKRKIEDEKEELKLERKKKRETKKRAEERAIARKKAASLLPPNKDKYGNRYKKYNFG